MGESQKSTFFLYSQVNHENIINMKKVKVKQLKPRGSLELLMLMFIPIHINIRAVAIGTTLLFGDGLNYVPYHCFIPSITPDIIQVL